jgi:O-antigen/teichoic acid export membrane protein
MLIQLKKHISGKWHGENSVNAVFRNMILLASGSGVAKVIGFVSTPIITRIYLPEHMGVLSVFIALTALLAPLNTLSYSLAIPLPKHDGTAVNLFALCAFILFSVSLLIFLLFGAVAPALLDLLSMRQLLPYWWLLPVALAGAGIYELLTSWAVREKAFKPIARTSIWQAAFGSTIKIGLGLLGSKPLGLLIGHIFSQAGGFLSLTRSFFNQLKAGFKRVSWRRMALLGKRYADFPQYRLPSQIFLVLSQKAPLFFFARQFGTEATGHLGLALVTIAIPMSLFGQTTGQAYYSEIAKIGRRNPEKIKKITISIMKRLVLISFLPCTILFVLGPWLFQVFFGKVWREAGGFASILVLYLFAQFVYTPIANGVLNVFEKQYLVLMINLSRVLLIFSAFWVSYLIGARPDSTLYLYSVTLSVQYILAALLVFRAISSPKNKKSQKN